MAENLKVNAKSKILTFKKKHNLLVDNLNLLENKLNEKSSVYVSNKEDFSDIDLNALKTGDYIILQYDDSGEITREAYSVYYKYTYENEINIDIAYLDSVNFEYKLYNFHSEDGGQTFEGPTERPSLKFYRQMYEHYYMVKRSGKIIGAIKILTTTNTLLKDAQVLGRRLYSMGFNSLNSVFPIALHISSSDFCAGIMVVKTSSNYYYLKLCKFDSSTLTLVRVNSQDNISDITIDFEHSIIRAIDGI